MAPHTWVRALCIAILNSWISVSSGQQTSLQTCERSSEDTKCLVQYMADRSVQEAQVINEIRRDVSQLLANRQQDPQCPACLTSTPSPASPPCPTSAPCPASPPCPTSAPCPTTPPCPTCSTCPTSPPLSSCAPCPATPPCPTCSTCPTSPPCPSYAPCLTSPPCPTCAPGPTRNSNCKELQTRGVTDSGVYTVHPAALDEPIDVYCDMETDGGGWMVFQRRQDGSVNFARTWNEYRDGFGELAGEFWLGNKFIHAITDNVEHEMRIDLRDWDDQRAHAKYSQFHVDSEEEKFRLSVDSYSGTAGDSLSYTYSDQNGQYFSTIDRDNDSSGTHCAEVFQSGFWFSHCAAANLNAPYSPTSNVHSFRCIMWYTWKGFTYSLKFTEMKMRPAASTP